MANRHLSRSVVLQSLFEWDFRGRHNEDIKETITRISKEFAPGMSDFSFVQELITNILAKVDDLDNVITKAAPDWPSAPYPPITKRSGPCKTKFGLLSARHRPFK